MGQVPTGGCEESVTKAGAQATSFGCGCEQSTHSNVPIQISREENKKAHANGDCLE